MVLSGSSSMHEYFPSLRHFQFYLFKPLSEVRGLVLNLTGDLKITFESWPMRSLENNQNERLRDHFASCCSAQYMQMFVHYVRFCSAHYVCLFIHNVWVVLYNIWKIVADILCNKNTAEVQWHPPSMSRFLHPSYQIWDYILTSLRGLNTVLTTI